MEIGDTEEPLRRCISCTNVPQQLLEKNGATNYFKQFGRITKITLRPKTKACLVEYEHPDSAEYAITQAGEYEGIFFNVTWNTKSPIKKKKVKKEAHWPVDPEVQAELDAMGQEFVVKRKYNKRPEETPKIDHKLKRTWKATEVVSKPTKKSIPMITPKAVVTSAHLSERNDLLNIIKQPVSTIDDKLKVLEARDKLIRFRNRIKDVDISKTLHNVGTCPDMCPEKERILRVIQHQVALYEQESGGRNMNPHVAVKQYSRSSADQESPLPHDLRNVDVLQMTMGYLLHRIMNLCDNPDANLGEWFHFLWDRTRGIRKDITQQELCCQGSVELLEQCARFHIHCSARLVAEEPSVFDQKINTENLTKCLQTLKYMYHDLEIKGEKCPHEAEFRAYVILLNLNDGNFLWEVQQLRAEIQRSQEIKFALDVYSALDKNNYVKFFKLVSSTTYLNACILLRYFIQVRTRALRTILKCYAPRAPHTHFPIEELRVILAFEGVASTVDFVEYYGLSVNAQRTHVILDKRTFSMPDNPYALDRVMYFIESKRVGSVGEVVYGNGLPPPLFENHKIHNSFDDDGVLKLSEFFTDSEIKEMRSKTSTLNMFKERSNSPINPEIGEAKRMKNIFKVDNRSENIFKRNENSSENIYKVDNRRENAAKNDIFTSKDSQIVKLSEVPKNEFGGFGVQPDAISSLDAKDAQKGLFRNEPKETTGFGGIQNKESIFGNQKLASKETKPFDGTVSIFGAPTTQSLFGDPKSLFGDTKPFAAFQNASIFGTPRQETALVPTKPAFRLDKTVFDQEANAFGRAKEQSIFGGSQKHDRTETDSAAVHSKPTKGGFSFKLSVLSPEQKSINEEDKIVAELELKLKRKNEEYNLMCEEEERAIMELNTKQLLEAQAVEEEKLKRLEEAKLRAIMEEESRLKKIEEETKIREVEARRRQEELRRAEEEARKKRELHQKMLMEQERIRKIEEERVRLKEERQRKLEDERNKEIERSVKSVLDKLLRLTEEAHKRERLEDLKRRYLNRRVISKWRSRVATNKRKRKAIDQSPLWISHRSSKDEARELFQESQEFNLNLRKRYKNGLPINFVPSIKKRITKIDLEVLVGNILRKKYIDLVPRVQNDIYWKANVVISDASELETKEQVENTLNLLLKWDERNGKKCLLEQNTRTTYCIERVQADKKTIETNGYIFIADNFSTKLYEKIKNTVQKLGRNEQIPIVLIIQHKNYDENKMYDLITSGYISDYKIINNRFTPEKLVVLFKEALQFLAKNVQVPPALELNTLKSFLIQYLGTELWQRVGSFAKWNFAYKKCLMKPNVVISLHNEALERLGNLIFHEDCYEFSAFPSIFQDFVRNKFPDYLPCDYKHFPSFWKDAEYKFAVLKALEDLKLPLFNEAWPAKDQLDLEKSVFGYLNSIFKEPERLFYKVMATILRNFDVKSGSDILWHQIVEIITLERMEAKNYDIMDTYRNKTIFNQLFVVYEVSKLRKYNTDAWFYVTNKKIREVIDMESQIFDKAEQDTGNSLQAQNYKEKYDLSLSELGCDIFDEDFNKSLSNLLKSEVPLETVSKRKSELENVQMLMADLKECISIQKEISFKFQNSLQDAIDGN